MNFKSFSLHPTIADCIAAAGYVSPTPIQARAIPKILNNHDVMGIAQTGTGKTAAFVLPILNRLVEEKTACIRALIVAPTRELVEQIHQTIENLGRKTGIKSATVYGGVGINPQIQKLKQADIVVACPGRLLDHISRNTVDLSHLDMLVVDEADQMFDMGFIPDIRRILGHIPQRRQTLLFSATMPTEIRRLAKELLQNPTTVQIGTVAPADTVQHALYPVANHLKTALLLKLLGTTTADSVLVFTRTKHRAKRLGKKLANAGYRSTSLQGNLSQGRRQAALDGFRDGTFKILVATDIAARGIDVTQVSHVINYDIPSTPDAYIHRIGRTGRATRNGEAFTFVTEDDKNIARAIYRTIGPSIQHKTLAGFNYDAAPLVQNKRGPHHSRGHRRHRSEPTDQPLKWARKNAFGGQGKQAAFR